MRPYLVFGAGAVGSTLAAYLARRGHTVAAVARAPHVEAIHRQGGIRVVAREETFLAPVEASAVIPGSLPSPAVILLTVQGPDVTAALDALGEAARRHPVVTFQNGIRAEEHAAPRCERLYGGVVRFTSTLLEAGEVRLRAPGVLIVGRYPEGRDELADDLGADFRAAGFSAHVSPRIVDDKLLKLLVNLVSGPPVLLRRTGREPVLAAVQVAVLLEARNVLAAAGLSPSPAAGIGDTIEELLERFREGGTPPDTRGRVYNSTWQNLHHRRSRLENDAYHGEIARWGKELGIPTPVNTRVLEVLEEVRRKRLGPEPFDREQFQKRFADLVDSSELLRGSGGARERGGLEV
jgi:2-dehydropantoate 2-reductase